MTHISGFERSQLLLLPEVIDDYIVADNPVRFIDAFVDGLDLELRSSNRKLKPLPPDPFRHQDSAIAQSHNGSGRSQLIERSRQIAEKLGAHAPDKVKATLMALFCRVEISSDRGDITRSRGRL